jgi:hypothetical protein
MKRRLIAERLERLESDRAANKKGDIDLTILTDAELQALTDAVQTGRTTPDALAAIDKAGRAALSVPFENSKLGPKPRMIE